MKFHFADMSRTLYDLHPIQKASRVDGVHKKHQIKKYGKETFADCPGILDYKNTGWILPAWDEIKVYCSDNATMAYQGGDSKSRQAIWNATNKVENFEIRKECGNMVPSISDGVPPGTQCPVKQLQPLHVLTPWRVETSEDVSLLLLPPMYHSEIVNDFLIFPGIVDYTNRFDTLNLIMSPRRTGTYTIKAGTPLLHIIPIVKDNYNATYGPAKKNIMKGIIASCGHFYRKYVMKRSKYNLELEE